MYGFEFGPRHCESNRPHPHGLRFADRSSARSYRAISSQDARRSISTATLRDETNSPPDLPGKFRAENCWQTRLRNLVTQNRFALLRYAAHYGMLLHTSSARARKYTAARG